MPKKPKIDRKAFTDLFALTPMQEGMLFHYLKEPGSEFYFEQLSLNISGKIDKPLFEAAWNFVIETNEMLRTVFRWEKLEKPVQIVLPGHKLQLEYDDFSGKDADEKPKCLEKMKAKDRQKKFDLERVPFRVTLCKIEDENYEIIISNHHILYDGWSTGIILKEFFQAYAVLAAGEASLPAVVKPPFSEFIRWNQNRERDKQKKFWENYLQGYDTQTQLPIKRKEIKQDGKGAAKGFRLVLEKGLKERLNAILKERRATLSAVFYCAWGLLLQKYCGGGDVVFGTTVSGRSAPINGIEYMVGLFINTIPLRIATEPGEKIKDLVDRTGRLLAVREEYENTSLIDIKGYSELQDNRELFDSIVVLENYPLDRRMMQENIHSPLVIKSYSIIETTPYPLTVSITTGEIIEIRLIYDSLLFEDSTISRLVSHLDSILMSIIENFEKDIRRVELLTGEEKQRILMDFNKTGTGYPRDKTLHRLFEEQTEQFPDTVALAGQSMVQWDKANGFMFGEARSEITYRELNERSNRLAHVLREKGVKGETVVSIMVQRSLEMIMGILGILKAGGAYMPVDADYPAERIKFMLEDAETGIFLAQFKFIKGKNLEDLFGGEIIPMDDLLLSSEKSLLPESINTSTNLAYIMYTSGSTGRPKGVLVEHRNVIRLVINTNYIELTKKTRVLQTGAPVFDATTFEVWGPLLNGGRLVLLNNDIILDPFQLGVALERFKINTLWLTSSLFNQLAREKCEIFSNLEYLLVGGDVLSPQFINLVRNQSKTIKIINGYGPTENTTFSTTFAIKRNYEEAIPIGRPIGNSTALIVNQDGGLQPLGVFGELWVGGDGVSRGYLNNVELTAEKFVYHRSNRSYRSYIPGKLYKTGDRARWLPDGNIEFSGRRDHQVKIRGFRIEPSEIEHYLLEHETISEAVVVPHKDREGNDYLCAYVVPYPGNQWNPGKLKEYLTQVIPGYMVPSLFVFLDKIPLTSNGKVDRRALPLPEFAPGLKIGRSYTPPRSTSEIKLVDTWAQILGIGQETIGIDDNFFELGGHSLKAIRLLGQIHKKFDVKIPLADFFKMPTVRGLAGCIYEIQKSRLLPIEPGEEKEYYELAPFQKRFWVFWQFQPGDISYNISEIMEVQGPLSVEKLTGIFKQLIKRHESLRTSFHLVGGEPVQRIQDEAKFEIEYNKADAEVKAREEGAPLGAESRDISAKRFIDSFIRPFDLSRAPLLRLGLVKISAEKHYIMFDLHHIVSDGVSIGIFIKEFLVLYAGEERPPLRIQYKDFVAWRKKKSIKTSFRKIETQYRDTILNIPLDFPRPSLPDFRGKTIRFEIGELEGALKLLSRQEEVTLYMVLLAAFNVFLARITGQEIIVVGSPIAGRQHPDLDGIIGLFINPLVMQNFPGGHKLFANFLREVKANALDAYENQDYQYEEMAENVISSRDTGRNPFYDVMFVLQNMEMPEIEIPGLEVKRGVGENPGSKFDLTLYYEEFNSSFKLEYSTALFKEKTIRQFIRYFEKVLEQIVENPRRTIAEIEIITGEEKRQVLYDFNDTTVAYPRHKCIYQLIEDQVQRTPGDLAVIQPQAGEKKGGISSDISLTYRELNEKSSRLARVLRNRGVEANQVVGLMIRGSMEMLAGILGILKAGGAYLPIDPEYPGSRITHMLENSGAALLLTDRANPVSSPGVEIVYPDQESEAGEETLAGDLEPLSGPDDLIYIIFTSGSTGVPKGAGVYHRGIVNLLHWFVTEFGLGAQDRNLLLTSMSFDLTQKNFYAPLITGGCLCIPGIGYFDPRSLLVHIHENRVTWINCTPSMFYKMVERENLSREKRLSTLRYVFLGGETISMPALIDWLESGDCHAEIVNTYGPTECTDISNFYRIRQPKRFLEEPLPIGQPVYNVRLYVPDKNLRLQPVGLAGELYIGGAGVGIGYINDKQLTSQKFIKHSFDPQQPPQLLYRTGDLVKWLPGGYIEFLGRIDHQVKIRGFRIELGEIENRLLLHPGVKETLVMARDDPGGEKYLCAYIVPNSTPSASLDTGELRGYLSRELPGYMVPAYFVVLEKMPLNPNGKVDRKALPGPDSTWKNNYVPPQNDTESRLAGIWAEVLGLDKRKVGIYDNFFLSGGHSLKVTALIGKIHKAFSVEIPIAEIFKHPTIENISRYLEQSKESIYLPIFPIEEREYYPLSSAQKRLFIIEQLTPGTVAYNIPAVLKVEGKLDRRRFAESFHKLIARHESLRTSFRLIDGEPVQEVHDSVEFDIEYYKVGVEEEEAPPGGITNACGKGEGKTAAGITGTFLRPFDLSRPPLLRVGLAQPADGETSPLILMIDTHHIISDGISINVFIKDFMAIYSGRELLPLKTRYKDFTSWQNRRKAREALNSREKFWLGEFSGEIPVLDLPTDFLRPAIQRFEGNTLEFEIGEAETGKLKARAQSGEATVYMVLLSFFNILLSKLSGQEEIVVGSPVAGRQHPELEQVIGIFINTLALKNYPSGEKRADEFLREVRDRTIEAQEMQGYPFEDLVDRVVTQRDVSRNPLFDTMFILQNTDVPVIAIPGLELAAHAYENKISKFDLTFIVVEQGERLVCAVEYSTNLFKKETVRRFIRYFKSILSAVNENPRQRLSEIEIISLEEKKRVLEEFNDTGNDSPADKRVHEILARQVAKNPDKTVLYYQDHCLTVAWTNRESTRLARVLTSMGVGPGIPVGIIVHRCLEMIGAIMGILKAGGAYVPIDPNYPPERTQWIMRDSAAGFLVTDRRHIAGLDLGSKINVIDIREGISSPGGIEEPGFPVGSPRDPVYVIYTSGSTGMPKGTLVEHRSVVNTLENMEMSYPLEEDDSYILKTNYMFDVSVTEIFCWLFGAGRVVILEPGMEGDPAAIAAAVKRSKVTHINFVPSMLKVFIDRMDEKRKGDLRGLKYVLTAGEVFPVSLAVEAIRLLAGARIENIYGPTEAAIYTTRYSLHPGREMVRVPIGKPLRNIRNYIVDSYFHPQPIGVGGEYFLGGVCLARGYLNRPGMTHDKFIENPFKKGDKLYGTGDLARWLPRGDIEFLGRKDHQVKIRGFRIELEEIEHVLSKYELIKEAVVTCENDGRGENYLCGYVTVEDGIDSPANALVPGIRSYLSQELPGYMIPSYFVQVEAIPVNPSGKVNRKALPNPRVETGGKYTAPGNKIERLLADIWAEVLGIENGSPGIDDNFFELGGHSLKATILAAKIQNDLGVNIPLAEIFKTPSIRALAAYIDHAEKTKYSLIEPVEKKEIYELSSAQQRLYFFQLLNPGETAYYLPDAFVLGKKVDRKRLKEIFLRLIERHESLRTSFEIVADKPVQKIHAPGTLEFEIEYYETTGTGSRKPGNEDQETSFVIHQAVSKFMRPFDLARAPLLRVGLVKKEQDRFILIVCIHHIIIDGFSFDILMSDFSALFEGRGLPPRRLQYKDFSEWQNKLFRSDRIKDQERYWVDLFKDGIPISRLTGDYPGPGPRTFEADAVSLEISRDLAKKTGELISKTGTTLYILLLAVYNILLSKYTHREDILVGTPISGRKYADTEYIIGIFVNMLPMRNHVKETAAFAKFLEKVKTNTIQVFENQDYQFEELEKKLTTRRDNSLNPFFDNIFAVQNYGTAGKTNSDFVERHYEVSRRTTPFDLTLVVQETPGSLTLTFLYKKVLYKPETLKKMLEHYIEILTTVVECQEIKIKDIALSYELRDARFDENTTEYNDFEF